MQTISSFFISPEQNPKDAPLGLFDKIITAITREKEKKQRKKIVYTFLVLFLVSSALLPFSWNFLATQWKSSGMYYFVTSATANMNVFFLLWKDFLLSFLESLPVVAIVFFAANIALFLFTLRLFLHKKGLLLKYIRNL